jgi:hypothetical protein
MTTLHGADTTVGPFREHNTIMIEATIMDANNFTAAIPVSALDEVLFTLYTEHGDQDIINSRNQVDITSFVDEDGLLRYALAAEDMVILDDTLALEYHRALLEWKWTVGSPAMQMQGSWEIRIIVRNLNRVTTP